MKTPGLRRIAIALGVLVLLLVAAAAVLIATFDANRYKAWAVDWMKAEHQRTLVIDGPIRLSLFPRLAVTVSQLRLSEAGSSEQFLAVDEAALAVQVLPLLRKQLVVDRVSARAVRAAYLRDATGKSNIDDFVSAPSKGEAPAPSSTGSALRFDVSAVRFDDLQLKVRDQMAPLSGDVTLQSFESGRLAHQSSSPVSLRAKVMLTQPQPLNLSFDGQMNLQLDLETFAVSVSDLKIDTQGDAAGLEGLSMGLEGALAWDRGALRGGPLKVALKGGALGTLALDPSSVEVARVAFSPDSQALEIDTLRIALAGRRAGDPFKLALDWPQLAVAGQGLKGSVVSGRFETSGATALKGEFKSAPPSGNFDALRLPDMALTLAGSVGPRKVEGSAMADLVLQIARRALTVERLGLRTTLADPGLKPLQIVLRGSAGGDAKAASWKLEGSLNENHYDSAGRVSFAGAVPQVQAEARFDDLDLNKLLNHPNGPAPGAAAAADTPVPLDGLKAVDGQFKFSAGALAWRHYKVADARFDATLDGGSLQVSRLSGRAWDGTLAGSGSANAGSGRMAVKLDASGVDVNAMLRDVAGKDLLEGRGRVLAELNTRGATVNALRSALAGTAALQLRDGAIKGINLARALRQAKAALTLKKDATTPASATEKTDFTELTVSARVAGGVAHSDDLEVKSPFLRIGGAGTFDIGRGSIDYTARATVIGSPAGQDGKELAALRGVTVPVLLTGPFDAIEWKIQWSGVAAAAIENKLKDKLAEKLGAAVGGAPAAAGAASAPASPKDLLKDKLKGLFK